MKVCLRASLVVLLLLPVGSVVLAEELGTAFTYQAQLKQNDVVVNDVCDFAFSLLDAAVDGVQVGATLTFDAGDALNVVDGLVTVSLDFGEGAFGDDVRWLEVSLVCPSGGGLETLDPRQEITATPAALKARGIDGHSLDSADGNVEDAVFVDNAGMVGIGTGDPDARLHVVGDAKVEGTVSADAFSSNSPLELQTDGTTRIYVDDGTGNVGIGTTDPQEKLHVDGGIVTNSGWFGTKDTTPMELYVNNVRAMRFEYAEVDATPAPNFIGGHLGNTVTPGAGGAVVAGGGGDGAVNTVTGDWGTVSGGKGNLAFGPRGVVGGGEGNTASGGWSAVSGGQGNTAFGDWSSVSGGMNNTADANRSTVAGGASNTASGVQSAVGGGELNTASGDHSMVPGGFSNEALGNYSFAAGRRAKANNNGSFVWADSAPADFASTGNDQFLIRAAGGVGIGTTDPDAALNVFGADNDGTTATLKIVSGAQSMLLDGNEIDVVDDGAIFIQNNSSGDVLLGSGGGNVGIGVNVPNNKLTVTGNADFTGNVGIGTPTPGHKLHLLTNGSQKLSVESTGNSGFSGIVTKVAGREWFFGANTVTGTHWELFDNTGGHRILYANSNGLLGIDLTGPAHKLQVNGNVCANSYLICSDSRLKENVSVMRNALDQVLDMRAVRFDWRQDVLPELEFSEDRDMGFIAQELIEVVPEVVVEGENGYLAVDYGRLTPVLVQAIQELNDKVEAKDAQIVQLTARLERMEARMDRFARATGR